jgi:hypothetical protein
LGEADHADPVQNSLGAGVQDRFIARVAIWCFKGVLQAFFHYFLSDQINQTRYFTLLHEKLRAI